MAFIVVSIITEAAVGPWVQNQSKILVPNTPLSCGCSRQMPKSHEQNFFSQKPISPWLRSYAMPKRPLGNPLSPQIHAPEPKTDEQVDSWIHFWTPCDPAMKLERSELAIQALMAALRRSFDGFMSDF